MSQTHLKTPPRGKTALNIVLALIFVALLAVLVLIVIKIADSEPLADPAPLFTPPLEENLSSETPVPEETPEPKPVLPEYEPYAVDSTKPENYIQSTAVQVNGEIVESYSAKDIIDFGFPQDYANLPGIVTFRGNNFRDSAAYGTANIENGKLVNAWSVNTSNLQAPNGEVWTGSGWVGQPLMMSWPKELRAKMNMYEWAKEAESLTEVIYATMDGNVYFLDLATGNKTRDNLYLGFTFKGAGALDPRGYPILYLGSGYDSYKGSSHVFVINLFDCSVMYEFGGQDSFSLRGKLSFFDGSPLVDAETDQLIYPGENGILYIIKLNTKVDVENGIVSVEPSNIVKWRYYGVRTSSSQYWLGMEDSAVIFRGHLIMSDNGGNLMCLDLSTLQLKWVQNVLDDTNCTPVLELEDGHPYIYTSTSFRAGWRAAYNQTATIPIWKIDAVTGEIIWQKDYTCYTEDGVSGGVQGTLAMGKNNLSDLIFVPVARTPNPGTGILAAISKETGEVVWEIQTQVYSWSSPVIVYDSEGNGYIVYCTAGGYMYLIDGRTKNVLDSINLGGNVEASPAVYNNTVVVGTRAQKIWGINIS